MSKFNCGTILLVLSTSLLEAIAQRWAAGQNDEDVLVSYFFVTSVRCATTSTTWPDSHGSDAGHTDRRSVLCWDPHTSHPRVAGRESERVRDSERVVIDGSLFKIDFRFMILLGIFQSLQARYSFIQTMSVEAWYLQPSFLCYVLSFVNLLNYLDRSIIPGSINQLNGFIQKDLNTDQPDIYLGILQAAFVVGFVVGFIFFEKGIRTYSRFTITAIGCTIWITASLMSGISYYSGSYIFLFFARVLSGVCEASIQCTIPPWIQSTLPPVQRGKWLGIFYTAIPVGTALGFAYSAALSETVGWEWAFFVEACLMVPFVIFMLSISKYYPVGSTVPIEPGNDPSKTRSHWESDVSHPRPSKCEELQAVIGQPIFIWLTLSIVAQVGVMVGISTFGSSFLVGLGFFNQQAAASSAFGTVLLLSGLIGTPVGGLVLDRLLGHLFTAGDSPGQKTTALHRIALFAIAMTSAGLVCLCLGPSGRQCWRLPRRTRCRHCIDGHH